MGPEGEHAGGEIVCGIPMGHVAADGPQIPHEGIRDFEGRVGEDRIALVDHVRIIQIVRPGGRSNMQGLRVLADVREVRDPIDIDEGLRLREPELHDGKQALPSRKDLRLAAEAVENSDGFIDRRGRKVLETRRNQSPNSCAT